jgi:hypothetical protein
MLTESDIADCRKDLLRLGLFDENSVDEIVDVAIKLASGLGYKNDPSPASLSAAVNAILSIGWNGVDDISGVVDKAMKELTGAV